MGEGPEVRAALDKLRRGWETPPYSLGALAEMMIERIKPLLAEQRSNALRWLKSLVFRAEGKALTLNDPNGLNYL